MKKTRAFLNCGGSIVIIGFNYLTSNLIGIYGASLAVKLGVEYSQIALMWTTMTIGSLIARAFAGKLFDCVNPKLICILPAFSYLIMISGLAFIDSVPLLLFAMFIGGIPFTYASGLLLQLLGSKWIGIGRGSIIGLASVCSAVFNVVFIPLATNCLTIYGFEKTAIVSGVIIAAGHLLVGLSCISYGPEHYGMDPIDIKFLESKREDNKQASKIYETKMPLNCIEKLPVFWILMILPALLALAQQGFYSNRVDVFTSMGLDIVRIGYLTAFFTVADLVCVWLFGFICDKVGYRIGILSFAIVGAVLWFSWPFLRSRGMVGAMIICFFANVAQINNYFGPNVMVPLFGLNKSNTLISWSTMGAALGGMLGPIFVALLPSYNMLFLALALLHVGAFFLTLWATQKGTLIKIKEADKAYMDTSHISLEK